METNDNKLMKMVFSLAVILVLVAAVVIGVVLSDKDKEELVVTASDITLAEGESKPIVYRVSNDKASIRFKIENPSIAEVNGGNVIGKAVGETTLTIIAGHNGATCDKKIKIIVVAKANNDPNEDKNNKPVEEENLLAITLSEISNCTIDGNTIKMTVGKTASFLYSLDKEYESVAVESSSPRLSVEEAADAQRVLKARSDVVGEFELTIKVDGKTAKFVVVVE